MNSRTVRGVRALVVAALIVVAAYALFHRPEASTPTAPVATSSVVASALPVPPGPEPTIDPESSDDHPPAPVTSCPAGLVLGDVKVSGGDGHGCGTPVGDAGLLTKEGAWVIRMPNGKVQTGKFVHDRREGVWTTWFPNGKKAMILPFKDGVMNGEQIEWAPSGQRFAVRHYLNGVLDGPAEVTFADGTVERQLWRQGRRVDEAAAFPSAGK